MLNLSLIQKGLIVTSSIISFGFLLNEYQCSRFYSKDYNSQFDEQLFYTHPNYFRCRNGLMFMDWILIIATLGQHFKPDLFNQNLNFLYLGIRTIISIIFLWDYQDNYRQSLHTAYFNFVIQKQTTTQERYDHTVASYNSYCAELYLFIMITICGLMLLKKNKIVQIDDANNQPKIK